MALVLLFGAFMGVIASISTVNIFSNIATVVNNCDDGNDDVTDDCVTSFVWMFSKGLNNGLVWLATNIPALVVDLLTSLAHPIMKIISALERHYTWSELERQLYIRYYVFLVVQI